MFGFVISMLMLAGMGATAVDLPAPPDYDLTYTSQANRQDDLYRMSLQDGALTRLTNHRAKDSHGVPSPDGRAIVFNSERVGWWKIWTVAADGSQVRQLTNPQGGADYFPSWSPNGTRIVFATGTAGNGDIVVMNADGTGAVSIAPDNGQDNFPVWSPAGDQIAFASDRDGSWGIWLVDVAGGPARKVSGDLVAIEPAWSPDARSLVVQGDSGEAFDLYRIHLDGSPAERLTATPHDDKRPDVSPDGKWLAFESDRAGGSQIFIMPAAGGPARQVTSGGYNFGAHWWPEVADAPPTR